MSIITDAPDSAAVDSEALEFSCDSSGPAPEGFERRGITRSFHHKVEDGVEQYRFPSAIHVRQCHYIDRCDNEPFELSIVQLDESLTIPQVEALMRELKDLHSFMVQLNASVLGGVV